MTDNDLALRQLPPLAQSIVDRAIDNMTRKLIAGARNRDDSRPNAPTHLASDAKDALKEASAASIQQVSNRGLAWREMLQKSLTHGISSLGTMTFDGQFTIKDGQPDGLDKMPDKPGVYVVFDQAGEPVYVGMSKKLKQRWRAGHLNDHRNAKRDGKDYKLSEEFAKGCKVKFIETDSAETARAIEAHLIKDGKPRINAKEELKAEQGKRRNIESQKMKNASGSTASLLMGAGKEAAANSAFMVFEQLVTAVIKAVKDELVDVLLGAVHSIRVRLKRFFEKVWKVVVTVFSAPLKMLTGIFEFIVNAVSRTMAQFCGLARNVFDLGCTAWSLYQGAKTMSTEALVQKISETVILSGTLIVWDALDPVLESQLVGLVGPAAPYLSTAVCAIGFGLSGFYLQRVVPAIVSWVIASMSGASEVLAAQRRACEQLIANYEREALMLAALSEAAQEFVEFDHETRAHVETLSAHKPIERLDVKALMLSHIGER